MPVTSSSEPRSILHLISELDDGGLEHMLTSVITRLDRQRYAPFVIAFGPEADLSDAVRHTGVPLHHLDVHRGSEIRGALDSLAMLSSHIAPALVHSWSRQGDIVSSVKSDLLSTTVPVLSSSLVTPGGKGLLGVFSKVTSTVEDSHHLPIRPAVDLKKLRHDDLLRASTRERWSLPQDAVVVGMCARQLPPPDYSTFFHAVAQLQGLMPNVHAVLTGRDARSDKPELAKLRNLCPRPDRVHLLGVQADMGKVLPAWDLCVNAVTAARVLPMTVAESLACGVPVVSSDQADAAAFLQEAGRVVKPSDVAALKDACLDILCRGPDARNVIRQKARALAESAFDVVSLVRSIEERYDLLLQKS